MEPVKLELRTIRDENGMPYVSMYAAENAIGSVSVYPDQYNGYGYPYYFFARLQGKEKTWSIYYLCPLHFREDYLDPGKGNSRDLYGQLYRSFDETSEYIDKFAKHDMSAFDTLTLIRKIPFVSNAEYQQTYGPQRAAEAKSNGLELKRYYYCGMVHQYSYIKNGKKRMRTYSAVIEAQDLERTAEIPSQVARSFNNPFMAPVAQMASRVYTDARYDKKRGWIYTLMHYLDWTVTQRFILDAPEEDFAQLYKQVFIPTLNRGVTISDEVWASFKKRQAEINAANKAAREKNQAKKEEEKRVRKQEADAAAAKRAHDRELQDYLRKTQKEISDIRRSSYENTRKTNAKVREMWGDAIRGDTRFVDKYGDEHVLHTYSDHAYKRGDTYVTSDSPLDHGWDWEELEKKKY